MNIDKEIRYLTIQKRRRKSRWLQGRKIVPEIRIGGLWLAREGFYPKAKIKVKINKNQLEITPYKPAS